MQKYKIKKLNAISSVIYDCLPDDRYSILEENDKDDKYDAILARSAKCHDMVFPERLKAIARAGVGVNNIPIDRCTNEGIVVFNTPGANANAVKELVLCGMFMASRNVLEAVQWVRTIHCQDDKFMENVEKNKKTFVGNELCGKTLGVVGLGAIGVMVANAATAIGMNVIGFDPYISVESAWGMSKEVKRALSLEDLLKQSDYISLHIPLIDKNKNFISAAEFSKMKKGVILLNLARNGLVDEDALLGAIKKNIIFKYVTDFPNEKLAGLNCVVPIPHLGASTPESEENCAQMAAERLREFLETGNITHSVNMPDCVVPLSDNYRITAIHKNLPNMVGQMSKVLGDNGCNIAEMVNRSKGDVAYTVFNLDEPLDQSTIDKLNEIEGVIKVRIISV
ncbi:MAG: phosphoglycerate dehydrogenase [Eubacteriales bacterium]